MDKVLNKSAENMKKYLNKANDIYNNSEKVYRKRIYSGKSLRAYKKKVGTSLGKKIRPKDICQKAEDMEKENNA